MTGPAVLLFDFGGTLDADGVAWKERFRSLFREEAGEARAETFDRAFYAADDALVGRIPRDLSLGETVARLSEGVARGLSLRNGSAAGRVARRFLDDSQQKLQSSVRLLEGLSQRYRLGIVSNFYGNLEKVCAETGIAPHVAVAVDSAAIGFEKPDARIFRAALERLGVTPSESVFVGDSLPRDMAGAKAVGMRHVWLSPTGPPACCPEDPVIASLAELNGVLR